MALDPAFRDQALRDELGGDYDAYIAGLGDRSATDFCDLCIENQKKKGRGIFNPRCERSANEKADALKAAQSLTPEEEDILESTIDGVTWALKEFNWEARWYQAQAMRCTAQFQAYRWGRRCGKTHYLAMRALHLCATKPGVSEDDPYTVLIVAPYEAQIKKIFEFARTAVAKSRSFKSKRDVNDPITVEFPNGSKMIGFTAGEKTGARSTKIRGQDAHAIIIDEADMIRQEDVAAILAILASHEHCRLYFSSTPSGLPTQFRKACEDPEMGFREFWFTSLESPAYTEYVDKTYKKMSGQIEYEHEYLAIFGQAEGGVFLPDQVADCLDDYPLGQALKPEEVAIIGVDCNDTATGTHAIVIGVTPGKNGQPPRFRMVDKAILRGSEFTHTKSASMLIDLYHKWDAVLLAMDKGFSQGQAESIIEYGMQNPKSRLEDRFKYYDLGSSYKFIDPMTAVEIKKPYKPLMVGFSQNVMQERRLTMPRVEDTDHGIIGQMKKFVITRVGADGRPIYSQGAEHSLTALMIGIMGWVIEVEGYEPYMPDHKLAIGLPPERADELILPVSTRRMPTSNKSREPREASQDLQRIPMNAPFRKRRSGPSSLRKHF